MERDSRKFLWDVRRAAELVVEFTRGKALSDLTSDLILRSAVERQMEIMGEAISQLAAYDLQAAQQIPDYRQMIAFRNILAHGYDKLNYEIVWQLIHDKVPDLIVLLNAQLNDR